MKRFLMVAPFFPPLGGIASLRAVRFARHLPAFGWEPIVITRQPDRMIWAAKDPTLLDSLPDLRVVKTGFADLGLKAHLHRKGGTSRLVACWNGLVRHVPPDPWLGWVPAAYWACRRVMAKEKIHVVMTTAPPQSTNLVGFALQRRTGLPWLADLRDEWTDHPRRRLRYACLERLDKRLERAILPAAEAVTVTSSAYGDLLASQWGPDAGPSVSVVTNSYDRELFRGEIPARNDRFTLVFAGSVVGDKSETFAQVLAAIEDLLAAGVLDEDGFRFKFVGEIRSRDQLIADRKNLSMVVEDRGFLPHREAVLEIRQANALLMVLSPARKLAILGKTFEYLAAGRPILAVVPKASAQARILRSSDLATIVEPQDGRQAIGVALSGLFQAWQKGTTYGRGVSESTLVQYEAATLARYLAEQLEAITQR